MEQPAKPITTPITKGIVISLVLIILALISYFLDLGSNKPMQYVGYVIFIIGIIWSVNSYGKQIDYNSTFGDYFAHGFKIAALVTLFMVIFTVLFIYLFPDIKEKGMEAARKGMEEKNMPQEQITQGMEITKRFFMIGVVAFILISYLILGVIGSLIGAAIPKKNPILFTDGH